MCKSSTELLYRNRSVFRGALGKSFNCIKLSSNQWIMENLHQALGSFVSSDAYQIHLLSVCQWGKKFYISICWSVFVTQIESASQIFHVEFNYSICKMVSKYFMCVNRLRFMSELFRHWNILIFIAKNFNWISKQNQNDPIFSFFLDSIFRSTSTRITSHEKKWTRYYCSCLFVCLPESIWKFRDDL